MHRATVVYRRMGLRFGRIPLAVRLATGLTAVLFAANAMGLIPQMQWTQPGAATLSGPWGAINGTLQRRAAVDLRDDFRHGLQEWRGRWNTPAQWSFDAIGFVHPGRIALYRPTLEMTDYLVEFDAQVDRQAIGFVFRASDFDNYHAVKLVIAQPGPLPKIQVVRYSVIRGLEGPHTVHLLPLTVRGDTTYQVGLHVQGSDFTLITQGKVADQWSDTRLIRGGVGFFCGKGDQARLGRIEVMHQNDTLGRLCAYIAQANRLNEAADTTGTGAKN